MSKLLAGLVLTIIIIIIFVLLLGDSDPNSNSSFNSITNYFVNNDKTFIKTSAQNIAKTLIISKGIDDFKNQGKSLNIDSLIDECVKKLFDSILKNNNNVKAINTSVLGPDDWALMGYDYFVDNIGTLDPTTEVSTTLNNEINNMKSAAIDNYDQMYYQNNSIFPTIIGPFHTKTNEEISVGLKKATTEYINNDILDFINNLDSDELIPNLDNFIDNYISSDPNYKDNFSKFSEDKLKPYIISELPNTITSVYNKKKEDIKKYLSTDKGILDITIILCKELGGSYTGESCSFDLKDDCDNFYKWPLTDPSYNIFTTFNNNTCLTSAHSGLRNLVEQNATDDDITYDSEYEKANITSDYCTKKGLEVTTDLEGNIDCKLTKNKPMLESILGAPLIDTINKKYDKNDYEECNTDEIDGVDTIPDNLKQLVNPLVKKYGSIEKSLCFDKTYGCSSDKELINDVCYIKCPDGYIKNPTNKSECYKLYPTFENNGELQNTDLVTKKTINNPYLAKDVCPDGYKYNPTEKKCIENCPAGYTYKEYNNCKKDYPARWDGKKTDIDIHKNPIPSRSKPREMKCSNPDKPDLVDSLCYAKCPDGHVRVPGAPYTCRPEPCPSGYYKTGVNTCHRDPQTTTAWYTKNPGISPWQCPSGYTNVAGVCWANSCPSGYFTSSPGFCMEYCEPGYTNVAGLCHDSYGRGEGRWAHYKPDCESWQVDESGSCWARGCWAYGECHCGCIHLGIKDRWLVCNEDEDLEGLLCYPKCVPGFSTKVLGGTVNICKSIIGGSRGPVYTPQSIKLPSTPASCPSDRENKDGMCQPKCADGYWSSSATTCETNNCPSGFHKTVLATCQLDAHTWPNPNIGAGDSALTCPEGTKEATPGGICYPTNPPEGYQRHSISVEDWTEKCPDEWTDTGWICRRPTKSVDKKDSACPSNSNDTGNNNCTKECEPGYETKNDKCVQKCPDGTVDNTETTCGREKTIINDKDYEIPYKYRIKKRINDYF